jgi:hypothetical protein
MTESIDFETYSQFQCEECIHKFDVQIFINAEVLNNNYLFDEYRFGFIYNNDEMFLEGRTFLNGDSLTYIFSFITEERSYPHFSSNLIEVPFIPLKLIDKDTINAKEIFDRLIKLVVFS